MFHNLKLLFSTISRTLLLMKQFSSFDRHFFSTFLLFSPPLIILSKLFGIIWICYTWFVCFYPLHRSRWLYLLFFSIHIKYVFDWDRGISSFKRNWESGKHIWETLRAKSQFKDVNFIWRSLFNHVRCGMGTSFFPWSSIYLQKMAFSKTFNFFLFAGECTSHVLHYPPYFCRVWNMILYAEIHYLESYTVKDNMREQRACKHIKHFNIFSYCTYNVLGVFCANISVHKNSWLDSWVRLRVYSSFFTI